MEIKAVRVDRNSTSWIEVGLIALIIAMHEIPLIPRLLVGNATLVPFMMLFLMIVFLKRQIRIKGRNILFAVSVLVFFLIEAVYKLSGISTTGFGYYVLMAAYYFFFAAMFPIIQRTDLKKKIFLLAVTVLTIFYTIADNALMYHRYGFDYFMEIGLKDDVVSNATNTAYSTALMLLSGCLLIAIMHDKDKTRRWLWIFIFCVVDFFNLLIAQRAITLLLSVMMYALIWVFSKRQTIYVYILAVFGAVILLLVYLNYAAVISFVSNLVGSERIAYKLSQIKRALDAGDISRGGGSLTARYELYALSIRTWLTSPKTFLFGVGEHLDNYKLIGNHSELLDVLGKYGLFGACFFYYNFFKVQKELLASFSFVRQDPLYRQILVICAIFSIRGVLGYVLYGSIGIQMFIIMPIILSIIKEKEIIQNDSINVRVWVDGL